MQGYSVSTTSLACLTESSGLELSRRFQASQTDALMLFGIHSTKYDEFLFLGWFPTSHGLIFTGESTAALTAQHGPYSLPKKLSESVVSLYVYIYICVCVYIHMHILFEG